VICADVRRNRAFPPKRPTPSIRRPFSILSGASRASKVFLGFFYFLNLAQKLGNRAQRRGGITCLRKRPQFRNDPVALLRTRGEPTK